MRTLGYTLENQSLKAVGHRVVHEHSVTVHRHSAPYGYPFEKAELRKLSKIVSSALIFLKSYYFRQNI